jgi:hypothetical protein
MELFKFNYATDPTVLERGESINRLKTIMWVERYRDPGEFELTAQLSSGLRDFLPLGTLISHADTMEVMIVENHEINEETDSDPTITVTGRSFQTYLENRIVGVNAARTSSTIVEYTLAADWTWNQAVKLINDHIVNTQNSNDALGNVVAQAAAPAAGTSVLRALSKGTVHERLLEILAVDDLGVKTIRRNTFTGFGGSSTQTVLLIFQGSNKTATVRFAWKSGDLDSAAYLFSIKRLKNSALVMGRYVYTMVDTAPTKYDRRIMIVNADDIDGNLSDPPTGTALTTILQKMATRGSEALRSQLLVTISRADVSKLTKYLYRRDYNIGDLVTLDGNFGQTQTMRVVEYVEIEDENGESGHPTLSIPGV